MALPVQIPVPLALTQALELSRVSNSVCVCVRASGGDGGRVADREKVPFASRQEEEVKIVSVPYIS